MKKIINYIKKNYIVFTAVSAALLICLGSFLVINLIKSYQNRIELTKSSGNYYQYFDVTRYDFESANEYENGKLVKMKAKNYNIYDSSLIYVKDEKSIIIPKVSSIVFYNQSNLTYRLPKYSEVTLSHGSDIVKSLGKKIVSNNFFIFDGEDTYFFPSNVVLVIDGKEINLSAYSYVVAGSEVITYYDQSTDKLQMIQNNVKYAYVKVDDVTIEILKDVTIKNDKVLLLYNKVDNLIDYVEEKNEWFSRKNIKRC